MNDSASADDDTDSESAPLDHPPPKPEPDDAAEAEGTEGELARLKAENESLRAEMTGDSATRHTNRARRRRHVAAVLLVVLGSAMLPVSVLTVWVRNQVFDTDRYVDTVQPLASDPSVQSAVANRIGKKVSDEVDFKTLAEEVLPQEASFLAVPIAAGADNLIDQAARKLVESEEFKRLWVEANRIGHDGLVAAITGRKGDVISTEDGAVVLNLGGLAQKVLEEIDKQFGLDLAGKIPAEKLDVQFVLVDSRQLANVQAGARMLDRLSWLSVIIALGLLGGSVVAEPDRRKGLRNVGLGIALSMIVLLLAFGLGRDLYLANLPEGVERPDAATAIFDTLTRFILQSTRVLFVLGAVLVVGAWLGGPSASASRIRGYWDRLLGRGSAAAGSAVDLGPAPRWVARHLNTLRAVILVAAAVVLLAWDRPTGKVVLLIAVLTLIPLAAVQLFAGIAATAGDRPLDSPSEETPAAEAGST